MISLSTVTHLRGTIQDLDAEILNLMSRRQELVQDAKENHGFMMNFPFQQAIRYMDQQEVEMVATLLQERIQIQAKTTAKKVMYYSREYQQEDTIITINGERIGDGNPHFIMGPCAVESYDQTSIVAEKMSQKGVRLLRGGAFKPRTSPYDFQGLGVEGLQILSRVAREQGMAVITEILSVDQLDEALPFVDVVQIGSRNMHHFPLLKALGKTNKPILLKRGLSATIEEFKLAAEYILAEGNKNVILCERGIRTYETATRNTLDISAVPILKQETHLPVIVDVTHSAGRKDILTAMAKAALAVGADGVMAEVHPNPAKALSDSKQQMDLYEFDCFMDAIRTVVR
ncbi:bifunctional 3-deoxy-7-phosphoheptulonate synthase/chorismate mutase [Thermoactinomyces sp. DSM 45891]|uniref:bifunctional 3-deoxy-7-phosphoheptulonate synthase/chorismate mutase n=1 Tax=Thermoactinomyces sp. DSM 45891 TaxID=1761907 RepID=UPI000931513C|nr:bifunctional 3-deoxy-7-phosphoheptulonate synthase/chorismate mutase [Thermoactinomyces sp. DSM 45891]